MYLKNNLQKQPFSNNFLKVTESVHSICRKFKFIFKNHKGNEKRKEKEKYYFSFEDSLGNEKC